MVEEKGIKTECRTDKKCWPCSSASSGGVYGLGFIGALIYFIQTADTFWGGVVGVLQSIVWPAVVVYRLLQFLGI